MFLFVFTEQPIITINYIYSISISFSRLEFRSTCFHLHSPMIFKWLARFFFWNYCFLRITPNDLTRNAVLFFLLIQENNRQLATCVERVYSFNEIQNVNIYGNLDCLSLSTISIVYYLSESFSFAI